MQLAIDSLPLSSNIFRCSDYSGLQVLSLSHKSAGELLTQASPCDSFYSVYRINEANWSDGKLIEGKSMALGLKALIKGNSFLRRTLFSGLQSISFSRRTLQLEWESAFQAERAVHLLPNWVPIRGKYSSRFKKQFFGDGRWVFKCPSTANQVVLELISRPEENVERFLQGTLDFSCDTALPLSAVSDNFLEPFLNKHWNGLFAQLILNKDSFDDYTLLNLGKDLTEMAWPKWLTETYRPIAKDLMGNDCRQYPSPKPKREVRLAYDNFYPNRLICELIASRLREMNWNISLTEDDFYRPSTTWDIKYSINRPIANDDLFKAYMLLSYPRSKEVRNQIFSYISKVEKKQTPFVYDKIWRLNLGLPLFEIPSLYLSRTKAENPLNRLIQGSTRKLNE